MSTANVRRWAWIGVAAAGLVAGCDAENKDNGFGFADDGTPTGGPLPTSDGDPSDAGSDGASTGGAQTEDGGESTAAGSECGEAARCVTAVPDDWMGPIAIARGAADGSDTPACGEAYPSGGLTLLEGYNDPGPAQCDCNCAINLSTYCQSYVYDYSAGCSVFNELVMGAMECNALNVTGGTAFYLFAQGGQPFCTPEKIETLPEVQWDAMVTSCTGATQGEACQGGGVCTPNAPAELDAQLCIFKQGDAECPAGDFSAKSTFYNGADDTRACGNCTCGTGTASCTGTLDVFASNDCTGAAQATLDSNGTCSEATVGAMSSRINFDANPSCPVEIMPEPVGEIAAGTAFTYCCEAG